ncbi:MAG: ABC transporter ATP-binding protein [Desulfobacter sp.]|nr:ABC transporter ATP-binding protein [Desulfobacter sp.]WDP86647.1 MAG: ABC transporter ATP-binding protein [Desulfobacter sp.]
MNQANEPILKVEDLVVSFGSDQGDLRAVDHVSFSLKKGQVLGIAGESGCGKSVTALSIVRLLPKPAAMILNGRILYQENDLLALPIEKMHNIRGRKISMIFQEPMTALNPVHSIGRQMIEVYELHFSTMSSAQMVLASVQMLEQVGIPDPEQVMGKYPHQLSGGMRQRVMIAMALACEPDILIADEPTTALDVTVQAQIMDLIIGLKEKIKMSVILITHDLGVIAENCDDVVVMYAGQIAEIAGVGQLFKDPCHPYTQGLLASIPSRAKVAKKHLPTIAGNVPPLSKMPKGCRFSDRCPLKKEICLVQTPNLGSVGKDRSAACHLLT